MRLYVQRMKEERHQLLQKIGMAKRLIANAPYDTDKHQIMLFEKQVTVMNEYVAILDERLAYEKKHGNW